MSEQQRRITKYVTRLMKGVAAVYHIHFLRTETDQGAGHMVKDFLKHLSEETQNREIEHGNAKFWKSHGESVPVAQLPRSDVLENAIAKMHSLHYEAALELFDKLRKQRGSSAADKFYKQRTEIKLVMGRWNEAFLLSRKAGIPEASFVCAIASAHFNDAAEYLDAMVSTLRAGPSDKDGFVSVFELVHLVVFVALATKTCEEVGEYVEALRDVTNYDLENLFDIASKFAQRQFAKFTAALPTLKDMWKLSIYTNPADKALKRAVCENVVVNAAAPFSRVSLQTLSTEVGLDKNQVINNLQEGILAMRIHGRLDLVAGEFIGGQEQLDEDEMLATYRRAVALIERTELEAWRSVYAETDSAAQK